MTTTTTTNFGFPIPGLGSVGTADGYGTLLQTADTALKTQSPWDTVGIDYATFAAMVASPPTNIVQITSNVTISENTTVPVGVFLYIHYPYKITVNANCTLKFPVGSGLAPQMLGCMYQIFVDNSGNVAKGVKFALGTVPFVRPEWWGAVSDVPGTAPNNTVQTANTAAINQSIYAGYDGTATTVIPSILSGCFYTNAPISTTGNGATGPFFALIAPSHSWSGAANAGPQLLAGAAHSGGAVVGPGAVLLDGIQLQMNSLQDYGIHSNIASAYLLNCGVYNTNATSDIDQWKIYLSDQGVQPRCVNCGVSGAGSGIWSAAESVFIMQPDIGASNYDTIGLKMSSSGNAQGGLIQYALYGIQLTGIGATVSDMEVKQSHMAVYCAAGAGGNLVNNRLQGMLYGVFLAGQTTEQAIKIQDNVFYENTLAHICSRGATAFLSNNEYQGNPVYFFPDYNGTETSVNRDCSLLMEGEREIVLSATGTPWKVDQPIRKLYEISASCDIACVYKTGLTVTTTDNGPTITYALVGGDTWEHTYGLRAGDRIEFSGFGDGNDSMQGGGGTANAYRWDIIDSVTDAAMVVTKSTGSSRTGVTGITLSSWPRIYSSGTDFADLGVQKGDTIQVIGFSSGTIDGEYKLFTVQNIIDSGATLLCLPPNDLTSHAALGASGQNWFPISDTFTIKSMVHAHTDSILIDAESATVMDKIHGMANGSEVSLIVRGANASIQKWKEADATFIVTGGGATYTNMGGAPVTAFAADAAANDAVVFLSTQIPSGVKIVTSQAFAATNPVFIWEYYGAKSPWWMTIPKVSLNDPWTATPGTYEVYFDFDFDADAYPITNDLHTYDTETNTTTYTSGFLIRCRLVSLTTPTAAAICSATLKCNWIRMSSDTFPASLPQGAGKTSVINLIKSRNIISEKSRSIN